MGRLDQVITRKEIDATFSIVDVVSKYTPLRPSHNRFIGLCPFHSERTPSFTVRDDGLFKCFGCGAGGVGATSFIEKIEHLDYEHAIDFLLRTAPPGMVIKQNVDNRKPKVVKEIVYDFQEMPFSKRHKDYFEAGELDETFVTNVGDIYAVKKYACNKKIIPIPEHQYMFCYVYKNEKGEETGHLKFLTLGRGVDKKDKWRTNVPNSKLWYLYKYLNLIDITNKKLFIVKSNKDALINMSAGIYSIATQSENATILNNNIPLLKKLFPNSELILNLGADKQGVEQSTLVSQEHKLKWFNTPKKYLINDINDPFEYVKNFGMENYIKLLKKYKML